MKARFARMGPSPFRESTESTPGSTGSTPKIGERAYILLFGVMFIRTER